MGGENVKITIEGTSEEIAVLVQGVQGLAGFKSEVTLSAKEITGAVLEAIRDKR